MEKFKVERNCGTCKSNFQGICAGGDSSHKYGEQITNLFDTCTGWGISCEYFCDVQKHLPWYIKKPYKRGNAKGKEELELLDMDFNNEPIEVNIYDLIEKLYLLESNVLAEVLNVTPGVVYQARTKGTPEKRKSSFSQILKIPEWFFDQVTTRDFSIIEKCKDEFMQEWQDKIISTKESAQRKYQEKLQREIEEARPFISKENSLLVEKYKSIISYTHDLTDDYKRRRYTVAIRLQEEDYRGNIFYHIGCGEYGLTVDLMADILEFISSLDCNEIEALNYDNLLLNDIELLADANKRDVHFVLRNDRGEELRKCIPETQLQRFIVGYDIICSEGNGIKKERRKCISCSHFSLIEGTAKGYCEVRRENVQRSRIICAFDYSEKESVE